MIDNVKQGARRSRSRRSALKTFGAAAALAAGAAATAHWKRAYAQSANTVRVWTLQSSPLQLEAYTFIAESFEKAHPGIKVAFEGVNQNDIWPKLAAAVGSGDVPDSIHQLVAPSVISLYDQGLLEPVGDVIDTIGRSDFQQNAIDTYTVKGETIAVAFANNSLNFWYRTDLFNQAGLAVPKYWDEYVAAAKTLTKGSTFGTSLPFGKGAMLDTIMWTFIYQAGGYVVAPDGQVTFNSPATVAALEFMKAIYPYVPTGATRYSWGETLNAYVTGIAATTMYTGRAMINVNNDNPRLADAISCAAFPYMRGGRAWWTGVFEALTVMNRSKNKPEAKLLIAWCMKPDQYIKFLHATPGHQIPILKSIGASPQYADHPLLKKYPKEVATMVEVLSHSASPSKPTPESPFILKAGDIQGSGIFAQCVQKVAIEGATPASAAAWGHDEIVKIVKG